MSREKAKLSLPLDARRHRAVGQTSPAAGSCGTRRRASRSGCPAAPTAPPRSWTRDGVPLTDADLNRRKHTCANCGSPLWQADKSGPARYPLADYVKHRMKGFFDLLVGG